MSLSCPMPRTTKRLSLIERIFGFGSVQDKDLYEVFGVTREITAHSHATLKRLQALVRKAVEADKAERSRLLQLVRESAQLRKRALHRALEMLSRRSEELDHPAEMCRDVQCLPTVELVSEGDDERQASSALVHRAIEQAHQWLTQVRPRVRCAMGSCGVGPCAACTGAFRSSRRALPVLPLSTRFACIVCVACIRCVACIFERLAHAHAQLYTERAAIAERAIAEASRVHTHACSVSATPQTGRSEVEPSYEALAAAHKVRPPFTPTNRSVRRWRTAVACARDVDRLLHLTTAMNTMTARSWCAAACSALLVCLTRALLDGQRRG